MIVSAPEFIHETVLLKETVASVLNVTVAELETGAIKKTGTFVDATFGRGGHSRLLLTYLDEDSRLLDQYSNHHFLSPPRLSLLIFMPTKFCINKTLYKKESAKKTHFLTITVYPQVFILAQLAI